jgi:hypothetical protein
MHAFRHPASRRAYGAALTAEQKEQYKKDVQAGKIKGQPPPRTAVLAESIRTGVPYEELMAGGGVAPENVQTVSEEITVPPEPSFPWVWVIGGTVLLGGLGFAAWYFTRPKPEEAFVPSPTV